MDPLTILFGALSVAITGLVKGGLGRLDSNAANAIKPFQPWIAGGLAILGPVIAAKTGITVDPSALLQAPATALATIGALEIKKALFPSTPTPPPTQQ